MSCKLSSTRLTQPLGRAEVDDGLLNPGLISGLFVPTMGYGMNVSPGMSPRLPVLALVGGMPQVAVKRGMGYKFSGSQNEYLNLGPANDVLDNTSCTILICEQRNSTAVHAYASFGYQINASDRVIVHLPDQANNIYFDYGNATAGSGRITISGAAYVAAGTVNNWAFVAGSRGREIWRNGVRLASAPTAKAARSVTSGWVEFRFGAADAAGIGRSTDATITMGMVSREQLSERALAAITGNPWRLFKPQERRIWAVMGDGGAVDPAVTTSLAGQGAVAYSGSGAIGATVIALPATAGVAGIGIVAYAGTGAISAAVGPAPVAAGIAGQGSITYAGSGAISITLAAPVSASVAASGGISYAGTGAISATSIDPAKPTVVADCYAVGGIVYAGLGAVSASAFWPAAAASVTGVGAVSYAGMGAVSVAVIPPLLPVSVDAQGICGIVYAGTGAISVREGMDAATESLYLSIADYNTHLSKASGARYLSIARI